MIRIVARLATRSPAGRVERRLLLYLAPACLCYAVMLSLHGGPFGAVGNGLTFNNMLVHLLHGRFDVDPEAIGSEGFFRDGKAYAYFGVLPALLRLPFLPLPGFAAIDFTRMSCAAAVAAMAMFKLLTAIAVWRSTAATGGRPSHAALLTLLAAAILFGGAQIQFLRASIYQEVLLWAAALAAAYLYVVVRGWLDERGFTAARLRWMALIAGLCLLTRVSTALGLYIATALVWLHFVWRGDRRCRLAALVPAAILAVFAVIAAWINYERWGNPLVFADLHRALISLIYYPDRIRRVEAYGEFNLGRLPYGLAYYFLPWWALQTGASVASPTFQPPSIDAAELPPASLLLSDPLLVGLAIYGLIRLWRDRHLAHRTELAGLAVGFLVPGLLMLVAISMTFRYRLEFFPLLEFCAWLGFRRLLSLPEGFGGRLFAVAAAAEIAMAQVFWFLYYVSPFGPAELILGHTSIIRYYWNLLV